MISIIKEICIFMIIAQAVLFFVPSNSYMKYVKILVGIIMILRITQPIFGIISGEEIKQEMQNRITELEKNIETSQEGLEIKGDSVGIYNSIEEELKSRLNRCEADYAVEDVALTGTSEQGGDSTDAADKADGDMRIIVTVSAKKEESLHTASSNAGIGKIEIGLIQVNENKSESQDPEEDEELKEAYGSCIGVDTESIEIIYK